MYFDKTFYLKFTQIGLMYTALSSFSERQRQPKMNLICWEKLFRKLPCNRSWYACNTDNCIKWLMAISLPTEIFLFRNSYFLLCSWSVVVHNYLQKLLWVLYDHGHLAKYPASLARLADLEEMYPTAGRSVPLELFQMSIESAKRYYDNSYVYPYTYIGNYHYRRCNYKEALNSWAQGATVISR